MRIEDHVFMHDRKISDAVRNLLRKYDLEKREFRDFASEVAALPDYSVINQEASDLILSLVADNVGSRAGLSTVTERQIDFALNTLNALTSQRSQRIVAADMLASAIIACEVPEEVQFVDPATYKEIRDAFADVREPFHTRVLALSDLRRLGDISDPITVQERIQEITDEFDKEVQKLKKSHFGRHMRRWMPISVGALTSLAGAVFAVPAVAITSAAVSVSIQVIQEILPKPGESEKASMQRLIGSMQKEVLDAAKIKRLIEPKSNW